MNKEDREIVLQFLLACLNDGYYSFTISGDEYMIDSKTDAEAATVAVENARWQVQRYRVRQAERELPRLMRQEAIRQRYERGLSS